MSIESRKGKSLAELAELYMENREAFEDIHKAVKREKPTFRGLSMQEMNDLYTAIGKDKFEMYRDNPTIEIEELKSGYVSPQEQKRRLEERRKELQVVAHELEMERQELEIARLRKELGMDFYTK